MLLRLLKATARTELTCPFLRITMCLESVMGVFLCLSTDGAGILHFEYMSYWDMHKGFLRNTSGGMASLWGRYTVVQ